MRTSLPIKLLSLLGAGALVLASSSLLAQVAQNPQQNPMNPFAGQAELSAADIPVVLEIMESLRTHPNDMNALSAVYTRLGIDHMRGMYLMGRVTMGLNTLRAGITPEQAAIMVGGPQNIPSEAEFEVIRENQATLTAGMDMPPQQ
ncbi:MAG: hypothetical protein LBQ79_13005 [Deltaproteobacteria bacterium]|jgi:hypothetical protein|nr:hypothetical protein [Deltaproteobacteria bacterium]